MPRTILGKVSLTPKGEYSPDTAYTALDVVNYGGSSWMALKDVTGVAPAEGENWMLLAQKGDQGASFTRLEKTAGTGAPGTTDTYTAYNSEGQAAGTVQVYQGMDGTGAGDFKADGTVPMTGDLQMAQHKITGLADATENGDAVNKGQMDAALAERADLTLSNLSNRQKALMNLGAAPSTNFLVNGNFQYNPAGKSSYGPGETVAGWYLTSGSITVAGNGVSISAGDSNLDFYGDLQEAVKGKELTFSILTSVGLKSGRSTFPTETGSSAVIYDDQDTVAIIARVMEYGEPVFSIWVYAGKSVSILAAKLEESKNQTLAYQDEDGDWKLIPQPEFDRPINELRSRAYDANGAYLGIVRGLGVRVNKNLLDNAYFKGGGSQQGGGQFPINQRGKTSWSQGSAFDRWLISKSSSSDAIVTLSEGGVSASAQCWFFERLDGKDLVGKQLTLSALLDSNELIFGTVTFNQQNSVAVNNGEFSLYMENRPNTTFTVFVISWIKGSGKKVVAAKLELGDQQTLAYQDEEGNWQLFETPDYAEELAKCQRYFFPVMERNKINATTVMAQAVSLTSAAIFIPLPCNMRVIPTATINKTALCELKNGNTQYPITSITVVRMSSNVVKLNIVCSGGGLTDGNFYPLINSDSDSYLFLSAEL